MGFFDSFNQTVDSQSLLKERQAKALEAQQQQQGVGALGNAIFGAQPQQQGAGNAFASLGSKVMSGLGLGGGGGAPAGGGGGTPQPGSAGQPAPASPMTKMDLPTLIQRIKSQNPTASTQVLVQAVQSAIPLLNQQGLEQWRNVQAGLGQQKVNQGEEKIQQQGQLGQQRLNQGQEKIDQSGKFGQERLDQGKQRIDQASQNEAGRNNRFQQSQSGIEQRFQERKAMLEQKLQASQSNADRAAIFKQMEDLARAKAQAQGMQIKANPDMSDEDKAKLNAQLAGTVRDSQAQIDQLKLQYRPNPGGIPSSAGPQPTGGGGPKVPDRAGPIPIGAGSPAGQPPGQAGPASQSPPPGGPPRPGGGASPAEGAMLNGGGMQKPFPPAPPGAIQYLKAHPETRAQFDAMFGPGSSARY